VDPKVPIAAFVLVAVVALPAVIVDEPDLDTLRLQAEAGEPDALFRYAICLFEGRGVERDESRAVPLLAEAAMAGHAPSAAMLGAALRARSDDAAAIEEGQYWTARAADLGHQDAMLSLSSQAIDRGDLVEAAFWIRAADRGVGRWADRAASLEAKLDPDGRREVDRRYGEWIASHPTICLID
jgi:TPR repeat protein